MLHRGGSPFSPSHRVEPLAGALGGGSPLLPPPPLHRQTIKRRLFMPKIKTDTANIYSIRNAARPRIVLPYAVQEVLFILPSHLSAFYLDLWKLGVTLKKEVLVASHTELGETLGMSTATVQRRLKELRTIGLITTHREKKEGGKNEIRLVRLDEGYGVDDSGKADVNPSPLHIPRLSLKETIHNISILSLIKFDQSEITSASKKSTSLQSNLIKVNSPSKLTSKKISREKLSDSLRLARQLSNTVRKFINRQVSKKQIEDWSKHIQKLIAIDGVAVERIQKVLKWYRQEDNFKDKFTPDCQSGRSLREKFFRLESAMLREEPEKLEIEFPEIYDPMEEFLGGIPEEKQAQAVRVSEKFFHWWDDFEIHDPELSAYVDYFIPNSVVLVERYIHWLTKQSWLSNPTYKLFDPDSTTFQKFMAETEKSLGVSFL